MNQIKIGGYIIVIDYDDKLIANHGDVGQSSEWSDEQNHLYIEKLELEILERKRKIQLAKIVHNMGETA